MLVTDERPQVFRTMLKVVDDCNKKGVPLVAHGLTMRLDFRFSLEEQWNLFDNVDAWREATLGTAEERKAKLVNPKLRQAMREEYDRTKQPKALGDIADFVCRKVENADLRKKYRDRTVRDIGKEENKHVVDVLIDVSAADNWKTEWLTPVRNQKPEYCKELLSHRTVAGFSDGGAHTKFQTLGAYVTDLLTWMVRDTGLVTLEQAHLAIVKDDFVAGDLPNRGTAPNYRVIGRPADDVGAIRERKISEARLIVIDIDDIRLQCEIAVQVQCWSDLSGHRRRIEGLNCAVRPNQN